jgi:hypothetical protein
MTGEWLLFEHSLHLRTQALKATAHVGHTCGDPDPCSCTQLDDLRRLSRSSSCSSLSLLHWYKKSRALHHACASFLMFLGPRDIVKRRGCETAANGRADCYKMVHEGGATQWKRSTTNDTWVPVAGFRFSGTRVAIGLLIALHFALRSERGRKPRGAQITETPARTMKLNSGHSRRLRQLAFGCTILERVAAYHHCQQSLHRAVELSDDTGCYRGCTEVRRALHRARRISTANREIIFRRRRPNGSPRGQPDSECEYLCLLAHPSCGGYR